MNVRELAPPDASSSAIIQIVEVVLGRTVTAGAKILARRAVDDGDRCFLTIGPGDVILVVAVIDIPDRIRFEAGRPALSCVAELCDIAVFVLAGLDYIALGHTRSLLSALADGGVRAGLAVSRGNVPTADRAAVMRARATARTAGFPYRGMGAGLAMTRGHEPAADRTAVVTPTAFTLRHITSFAKVSRDCYLAIACRILRDRRVIARVKL